MKFLVDVNLSRRWMPFLEANGHTGVRWSTVGPSDAPDSDLIHYARESKAIILTNDLDFGAILADSGATSPSVVLLRTPDTNPEFAGQLVLTSVLAHSLDLVDGALITIDPRKERRVRLARLPLTSL